MLVKTITFALAAVGALIYLKEALAPKVLYGAATTTKPAPTLMLAAIVYLLTSISMNHVNQHDIIALLKKCYWSVLNKNLNSELLSEPGKKHGLPESPRTPKVHIKQTLFTEARWMGRLGYLPSEKQNGAWIQISFPNTVRGQSIIFNIVSGERPWEILPAEKIGTSIAQPFLDNGIFESPEFFGLTTTNPPPKKTANYRLSPAPPEYEDIVWKTWVPLTHEADFIELQVWYPGESSGPGNGTNGYLYQVELTPYGKTAVETLPSALLNKGAADQASANTLEIP